MLQHPEYIMLARLGKSDISASATAPQNAPTGSLLFLYTCAEHVQRSRRYKSAATVPPVYLEDRVIHLSHGDSPQWPQ